VGAGALRSLCLVEAGLFCAILSMRGLWGLATGPASPVITSRTNGASVFVRMAAMPARYGLEGDRDHRGARLEKEVRVLDRAS